MTNGPNKTSSNPDILNPYPKGSARWRITEKRLAAERKAAAAKKKKKKKTPKDTSKRRKYLDEQIDK